MDCSALSLGSQEFHVPEVFTSEYGLSAALVRLQSLMALRFG